MKDLNGFRVFCLVVENQGFTDAAKSLGVSVPTVSRRIGKLEKQLGVQLVHRTPRHFSITAAGHKYYEHCKQMLAQAKAADEQMAFIKGTPSGTLTISCVPIAQSLISQAIPPFNERYPAVRTFITVTEREPDHGEHFDVSHSHQARLI